MSKKFYLSNQSSSSASAASSPTPSSPSSDHSSTDTLPFPTPLQRSPFLDPDFHPAAYLSTLHDRHQTLEDLRAELRGRSQQLGRELLDLVNSNYQDFLGLGTSLQGGEEKVEEVRVGLLGLRKALVGVRGKVKGRLEEVDGLVRQREAVRRDVVVGRGLLEVDERLRDLEAKLMVESAGAGPGVAKAANVVKEGGEAEGEEDGLDFESDFSGSDDEGDDEEDDDDEEGTLMSISKIRRHVAQYLYLQQMIGHLGSDHPFLVAQQPRVAKVRNTLLLDLSTALKESKDAETSGSDRILKIVGIYREMDEAKVAVQVLKDVIKR